MLIAMSVAQPFTSDADQHRSRQAKMLIGGKRLRDLPKSTRAYGYMKRRADAALKGMNLSSHPSATSPWLPNYGGRARTVTRPGTQTLAAALVYARTGRKRYRHLVVRSNRYLIGTEEERSTDGTGEQDKLLATSRQIGAYVVAANLVGMDPGVTGSRPGWESTSWRTWLAALRTKPIGTSGQASDIKQLSKQRANNWGSFARAARIAIDIYLNDDADLGRVVARYKLFLGERPQVDGFEWRPDQDLDLNYACAPGGSRWSAINPPDCGTPRTA